jgi:hypothetical protein
MVNLLCDRQSSAGRTSRIHGCHSGKSALAAAELFCGWLARAAHHLLHLLHLAGHAVHHAALLHHLAAHLLKHGAMLGELLFPGRRESENSDRFGFYRLPPIPPISCQKGSTRRSDVNHIGD